jgi:hypothetical protein
LNDFKKLALALSFYKIFFQKENPAELGLKFGETAFCFL